MLKINPKFTKKHSITTLILWILATIFLTIGIYSRLHNIKNEAAFFGDQAEDLLIANNLLNGHLQLVGPKLSAYHFYTPPTYYYILASLLLIGKTPANITILFGVLNILGILILTLTIKKLTNTKTALILLILMSLPSEMIGQSRIMWQPHPLFFLLSISIYYMTNSLTKKSLKHLSISILFFLMALTTYISPILLFPYFLKKTYQYFQSYKSKLKSIFITIVLFSLISLPFFTPQIIFEIQSNFPTLHSFENKSFGAPASLKKIKIILTKNVNLFWKARMSFDDTYAANTIAPILFVILTIFSYYFTKKKPTTNKKNYIILQLIDPISLIIGFMFVLVYKLEIYQHRLVALIPFFFLYLSFIINTAFNSKHILYKILVTCLIIQILSFHINLHINKKFSFRSYVISLKQAKLSYQWIIDDIKNKKINLDEIEIIVNSYPDDWNQVSTIWYFMAINNSFPIYFDKSGNSITNNLKIKKPSKYTYLFYNKHLDKTSTSEYQKLFIQKKENLFLIQQENITNGTEVFVFENSYTLNK